MFHILLGKMWWVIHICVCIAFCICFQLHQWRIQRGFDWTPSLHPVFKYPIGETKLFYFHGIFKKNEIKSTKRTLYEPPFPEILDPPLNYMYVVCSIAPWFASSPTSILILANIDVEVVFIFPFYFYGKYFKCFPYHDGDFNILHSSQMFIQLIFWFLVKSNYL